MKPKYLIYVIDSNGYTHSFVSTSRNTKKKHLRDHGGTECIAEHKGKRVSMDRYSDEFGYYNCSFEK